MLDPLEMKKEEREEVSLKRGIPIAFENGRLRGEVDSDYFQSEFMAFLKDLPGAVTEGRFPLLKEREDRLYYVAEVEQGGIKESFFLKVDDFTRRIRLKKWIRNAFVSSRAKKSWEVGRYFRECRLPTPQPVAFLEAKRFGCLLRSYLLVKHLPSAEPVHQRYLRLNQKLPVSDRMAEKEGLIAELSFLLASLHQRGISYGDLKASNIMAYPKDGKAALSFIDLESVTVSKEISVAGRVDDLGSLLSSFLGMISAREAFQFLNRYLETLPLLGAGKKEFVRAIYQQAVTRKQKGAQRHQTRQKRKMPDGIKGDV